MSADKGQCELDLSTLLVRPLRAPVEGEQEHVLRLAHVNGLLHTQWLVRPKTRAIQFKLCPLCLTEHGMWFQSWRKLAMPVCQQHKIWLLDTCTHCGSPFAWPRIGFRQCQCGADLDTLNTEEICSSLQECLEPANKTPVEVLLWLGAWSIYGALDKPLKKASCQALDTRKAILSRGAEIVCTWPQSFAHALTRHRQAYKPKQLQRFAEAWLGLVTQIERLSDVSWRERIWQCLNQFVAESHLSPSPIVGRNPKLISKPKTQKAVANDLGIGINRLHTMIAESAPTTPTGSTRTGRQRRVVTPDVASILHQSLSKWVTIREGSAILGCGRGRTKALATQGVFDTRAGKLRRESVQRHLEQVLALAAVSQPHIETEPLEHVWRFRIPIENSKAFLLAVFQKRIRIYGATGLKNIQGVHVNCADVQSWMSEQHSLAQLTLSVTESAVALGIKEQVAYELVDRGFLHCTSVPGQGRRVTHEAVNGFRTRYVALSELTGIHGIHSHSALSWALAKGLHVVSGPRIDGGRQYFVERISMLRQP